MRPAAAQLQDAMRDQFRRALRREMGRYLLLAAFVGFSFGVGAGAIISAALAS